MDGRSNRPMDGRSNRHKTPSYKLWPLGEFPVGLECHRFTHKITGQYGAGGLPNNENLFNTVPSLYMSKKSQYEDIHTGGGLYYVQQNNDYGKTKLFYEYHKGKKCNVITLNRLGEVHTVVYTISDWICRSGKYSIYLSYH